MGWVWLVQEEEEEEVAPRQEKMVFTVKLTQFDAAKKVQLIKAIKSLIPNMNLVQVRQSLSVCSVFIKAIKSLIPNMNLVQVRQSLSVCSMFSVALHPQRPSVLSCWTFFMEVLSITWAYSGVALFKVVHYQFMARVR